MGDLGQTALKSQTGWTSTCASASIHLIVPELGPAISPHLGKQQLETISNAVGHCRPHFLEDNPVTRKSLQKMGWPEGPEPPVLLLFPPSSLT